MKSSEINELAAALVAAQAEFSAVPKGSANPFFKSKYAALPDVVQHTSPVLARHGLAVSQFIESGSDPNGSVYDGLTTYVIHKSGQFIAHTMRLHLIKDDPQGQGSAVTYARRYSYMSALGLVADDDDDGNSASKPQARQQYQNSAPQAPAPKITGEVPAAIKPIIEAAEKFPEDEFMNSLATQFAQRGSLSEKQINAGKKAAYALLKNAGESVTDVFPNATEYAPGEEPF
jgi:hypothetical protein